MTGIKTMKIYMLLISLALIVSVPVSQTIPPGAPLVNTVQAQGIIGLNFSGPGNLEQIAYIVINSNDSSGFILELKLTNRGNFISGASSIPMTELVLNSSSGTLGAGLSEPHDIDILTDVNNGEYIWNPGNPPTTVTSNYMVELKASWADPSGKLAGFYLETITVTISAGGL